MLLTPRCTRRCLSSARARTTSRSCPEPAGDHAQAQPNPFSSLTLSVVALRHEPAGNPPPDVHAIAAGMLSVGRRLPDTGPVVLAVDDVQWLDAPPSRTRVRSPARRSHPAGAAGRAPTRRERSAAVADCSAGIGYLIFGDAPRPSRAPIPELDARCHRSLPGLDRPPTGSCTAHEPFTDASGSSSRGGRNVETGDQ